MSRHGGDDLWRHLVEFGALSDLGAVELCLVARALGANLAAVPYSVTAAARFAAPLPVPEERDDLGRACASRRSSPPDHFLVEVADALALVPRAAAIVDRAALARPDRAVRRARLRCRRG